MTYCYTRKDAKTATTITRLTDYASEKVKVIKAVKPKTMAITAAAVVIGALILMQGSAKTAAPTAAQTVTAAMPQLAGGETALVAPLEKTAETTTKASTSLAIPGLQTYRDVDSSIRDFQIDNAHLGHKMKMAMISDRNPIKHFYYWMERTFSFPALLVALAFLFSLVTLGFVRATGEDIDYY